MYKEPALIIVDIIQTEMALENGRVMLTNQKYNIPTDGPFICISYVGPSKIISNVNEALDNPAGGMTESQWLVKQDLIQIDIMAYSNDDGTNDARNRKEEIAMALHSLYAETQMELNFMQIARQVSPMMDTSFLEATEMMSRYTMTIQTTSAYQKQKPVGDYYTDFSRAVPPTVVVNA